MYLGFYDGPIEGVTLCPICQQCYYYKAIDYYTDWYCRIFSFSKTDYDFFELAGYFNITIQINKEYYCIPCDINDSENTINQLKTCPITHICAADAYIRFGYWMEWSVSLKNVNNWYEYLGIVIDKKIGCFRLQPDY